MSKFSNSFMLNNAGDGSIALLESIKSLSPSYFALVMATGIISIGSYLMDMYWVSYILFGLNNLFYICLWILTLLRIILFFPILKHDLTNHKDGPGFFTIVAGTCVLGIQYIIMFEFYAVAVTFVIFGILLWLFLTYTIFTTLTTRQDKPTLDQGISGGWLTAIVATQSVSILSAVIATHTIPPYRVEINFFALSMWLWGGMFYIWMISLIFYRYTFFKFSPDDLAPPYWINMGAMAISTLGGSVLILNAPDAPFLESLLPFIKGFTVFYWATGTWWIPMLLVLAIWRHGFKRFPLTYDALYWGAVFPLGMYAACTYKLAGAMGFHFLDGVAPVFLVIACLAWAITFTGFVRNLWRNLFRAG